MQAIQPISATCLPKSQGQGLFRKQHLHIKTLRESEGRILTMSAQNQASFGGFVK